MRIADDARKCVAYLGYETVNNDSEIDPIGTGFFVHVGSRTFPVTAHVAAEFGSDPFVIRLNDKRGIGRTTLLMRQNGSFTPLIRM